MGNFYSQELTRIREEKKDKRKRSLLKQYKKLLIVYIFPTIDHNEQSSACQQGGGRNPLRILNLKHVDNTFWGGEGVRTITFMDFFTFALLF